VIGTQLKFADLRAIPQTLPIQIAVLAPPSAAAEGTVDADKPFDFVAAKEVGDEMGYGSPAYRVARMLRPETGGGVSTIRTAIFPIIPTAAVQATDVLAINIAGVNPTKNTTHILNVNGRRIPFSVLTTDDVTTLANRIKATLDAALQINPVDSVVELAVANDIDITMTVKWNGASGNGVSIVVEAAEAAGVVYTNPDFAAGAGTFDLTAALANFGETWFNIVINACDVTAGILDQLETFNGSPEDNTGRWLSTVNKPFVALYGSIDSDKDTITTIPDARKLDLTNVLCPAPGSPGLAFEAAGAYATQIALTVSRNPPKSYSGLGLLDMPVPDDVTAVGDFATFEGRDFIEKKGVSTATLKGSEYVIEDVNTHYHPDGITPSASPYFRVVNVLGRSFNVIYQYKILVETTLIDKILVPDINKTTNTEAISPKEWKGIVGSFVDSQEAQAISVNAATSRATIQTDINQNNPERMETSFELIYSSNVRQADSTIRFGFNFG
jgi:phage tail sheath gpL-like